MAEKRDRSEFAKRYGQIVARAWSDNAFKQRLLSDPASVLREFSVEIPAGTDPRVVEETDKVIYFVLPAKPAGDLSATQLEDLSGGFTVGLCAPFCGKK